MTSFVVRDGDREQFQLMSRKLLPKSDLSESVGPKLQETELQKKMRLKAQEDLEVQRFVEDRMNYLRSLQSHSKNNATRHADATLETVEQAILSGEVAVSNKSHKVEGLLTSEQISEEQRLHIEMQARRQETERKMRYLDQQLLRGSRVTGGGGLRVSVAEREAPAVVQEVLSKEEHEALMRRLQAEKKARKEKNQHLLRLLQKQRNEEENRRASLEVLQKSQEKERRKRELEDNMKHRKDQHDKFISLEQRQQREFTQIKRKKALYQHIQAKYVSDVVLPELDKKAKMLEEIKHFKDRYNLEAVRTHEQEYLSQKREKLDRSRASKPMSEWHYDPPQRSHRLDNFLEEEAKNLKDQLERQSVHVQEKMKRQRVFIESLKKRGLTKPEIDEEKRKEIEERIEADEGRKNVKEQRSTYEIGLNYLKYSKEMRRADSLGDETPSQRTTEVQKSSTSRLQNTKNTQYFQHLRRKKLQRIVASNDNQQEKLMQLQIQSYKIEQKLKHKEEALRFNIEDNNAQTDTAELVLSSIRAKMGIMTVLSG